MCSCSCGVFMPLCLWLRCASVVVSQKFFVALLATLERVLAAVEVLTGTLPEKLKSVDTACKEHITSQLRRLKESACDPSNFPFKSAVSLAMNGTVLDAGVASINNALASLEAFQLCCASSLRTDAAGFFDSAKQGIKTK